MKTENQVTLEGLLDQLRSIESGKNYGASAEVDALAQLAEDLHDLSQKILGDKLQRLAEQIVETCPSVESVIDAQGSDFIRHRKGHEISSEKFPLYHKAKDKWSDLFNNYPGTYVVRKES